MSSTDSLDAIRKLVGEGMATAEGHNTVVGVPAFHLQALLRSLGEQETELMLSEKERMKADGLLQQIREGLFRIEESLAFTDITEFVPRDTGPEEADAMYEVFVDDGIEGGHMFGFWSTQQESFYRFLEGVEGTEVEWLEHVTHWRDVLGEPGEEVDLAAALFPQA